MAKKTESGTTTTTPETTVKRARRDIRAEIDAIPAGVIKEKVEKRYAAFLDDRTAVKASKKALFSALDFAKSE